MHALARRVPELMFMIALFVLPFGCGNGGGSGGVSGGEREPDWTFQTGAEGGVLVDVSGEGSRILAGGDDLVHLLSTDAFEALWAWQSTAEFEDVDSVALSRDGTRGVVSGEAVYVFDGGGPAWSAHELWLPGGGYTSAFGPVAIDADGSTVAAAGTFVTSYDGATGTVQWVAQPLAGNLISMSADGRTIAAELAGPGIALFDASSATPLWVSSENVLRDDIAVSADGRFIAVSGEGGVTLYGRGSSVPLWTRDPVEGTDVTAVAMTADGSSVIAGGAGFVARIASGTGDTEWIHQASLGGVFSVAVSADGTTVAAGSDWGVVTSFTGEGKVNWSHSGEGRTGSVSLSSDGRVLAAGNWGTVRVFVD